MKRIARAGLIVALVGCSGSQGGDIEVPAPPRVISFPEAQEAARPGITQWLNSQGNPPPTPLRFYIVQEDWQINRHEATGNIISRSVESRLFYRGGQSGNCYKADCTISQQDVNGTWAPARVACQVEPDSLSYEKPPYLYSCASIERHPPAPL